MSFQGLWRLRAAACIDGVASELLDDPAAETRQEAGISPNPQFRQRPWGYDRAEVDAFVEHTRSLLADGLPARSPENAVKAALDRLGEETSAVLQRAHEIADEVTARSQQEAEERRQRAEHEAAVMQQAAEARVTELDAGLETLWQERQRLLDDIERISKQLHALVTEADERFAEEQAPQVGDETAGAVVVETAESP